MSTDLVREKLRKASVPETVIATLETERLLDEALLHKATALELKACGIPMGDALRVKGAFPSPGELSSEFGVCQECGASTKNKCDGCNNYTHSPGFICSKCSSERPCTYGHW